MRTDDNWLAIELDAQEVEAMTRFTPPQLLAQGLRQSVTIPPSRENAVRLYRAMDAHFHAWTGQWLRDFNMEPTDV